MGKKNRKSHEQRFIEKNDNIEKSKQNKKIIILCAAFLLLTGLIIIFSASVKTKLYPYQPENIDIQVTTNNDGTQDPNAGVQKDVMTNEGAATVDDITGGVGNPTNQGQGIDEMLRDKEIDVGK